MEFKVELKETTIFVKIDRWLFLPVLIKLFMIGSDDFQQLISLMHVLEDHISLISIAVELFKLINK